MSEARDTVNLETGEITDDADTEELETPQDDGDDDDEDGEREAKPSVDWEKRAHDREGAMARERSRRRAAERTVSELNERIDRIEAQAKKTGGTRREQLIGSLREDPDEPLTDLDQLKAIARTLLEEEREQAEAQEQQQAQTNYVNKLTRQMVEFETDFRADHKDYDKACEFYKTARTEELEDLGYVGERLMNRLAREMYSLVDDTLKGGRDPAEAVYSLAKRRGFNGTVDDATRKLQKLQKGAQAGTQPRGSTQGNGRVTYEQVTRAKGADRDKLWATLRKQEMGAKA